MLFSYNSPLFYLFVIVLPFLMLGQAEEEPDSYDHQNMVESNGNSFSLYEREIETNLYLHERDPVIKLLGKSFDKIIGVMGDPDEQGYSSWNGPHHYMLYNYKDGSITFHSPEELDNKTAISMSLGEGQTILGVEVGSDFEEIRDVLGKPDSGPEPGLDDLYYMDYHFGEKKDGVPEVFISFTADTIDGETRDVFVKWEAFDYKQKETFQVAR